MTRHGGVKDGVSRDGSPAPDGPAPGKAATSSSSNGATGKEKENSDERKPGDDKATTDLFDAHDFDIQIDLVPGIAVVPAVAVPVTAKAAAPLNKDAPKRCLNLDDYKKRKGLI
jgi:RNA polymerase-associated protein RTF1